MEKRLTDQERLERIKTSLHVSDAEAQDILAFDKKIDKGERTEYDLSPEQEKIARTFAHTGSRKAPTVYKFSKRERKPNATKGAIIGALCEFLQETDAFLAENVHILNKERQIAFESSGETFELTLVQKRKKK